MKLDATSLRERLRALASGGATVIGEEPQPTPRPVAVSYTHLTLPTN